jgi:hypothetical protein
MKYNVDLPPYGDLMSVDEFSASCDCGGFIDYDGYGYAVRDQKMDNRHQIYPSMVKMIPSDATHILWFNK